MKISAALIMKNEEEHLPRLLKSLQGKFEEIVVVDTGSSDRSIDIAKEYGCKVYEKEWNGFSDARNYAISKCEGDWIWHFDADFELEDEEFSKFLLYASKLLNSDIEALTIYVRNFNAQGILSGISSQTFIHKKSKDIYWQGNIHEVLNIKESLLAPIYINHYGYQNPEILYQKALRNLELIKKDMAIAKKERNEEELLKKFFYLFQSYAIMAFYEKKLDESYEQDIKEFIDLRKNYINDKIFSFFSNYSLLYIAHIYSALDKQEEAKNTFEQTMKEGFKHPDILYDYTNLLLKEGKKNRAKEVFVRCLDGVRDFEKNKTVNNVVDNIEKIWEFIETKSTEIFAKEDIELIQKKWKKTLSPYFAALLLELLKRYDPQKVTKIANKIQKVHNNNERVLLYMIKSNLGNNIKLAQKIVQINPKNAIANKILGVKYWDEEDFEKALHHFATISPIVDISDILSPFIETLQACGFEQEANKLQFKLKK